MSELFDEIANKKDGYRHLLKRSLEAIMKSELNEFNLVHSDSSNGLRIKSVFTYKSGLEQEVVIIIFTLLFLLIYHTYIPMNLYLSYNIYL